MSTSVLWFYSKKNNKLVSYAEGVISVIFQGNHLKCMENLHLVSSYFQITDLKIFICYPITYSKKCVKISNKLCIIVESVPIVWFKL